MKKVELKSVSIARCCDGKVFVSITTDIETEDDTLTHIKNPVYIGDYDMQQVEIIMDGIGSDLRDVLDLYDRYKES